MINDVLLLFLLPAGSLIVEHTIQSYHFGIGAPPILVYFNGDWDVHWGYGVLTNGQLASGSAKEPYTVLSSTIHDMKTA